MMKESDTTILAVLAWWEEGWSVLNDLLLQMAERWPAKLRHSLASPKQSMSGTHCKMVCLLGSTVTELVVQLMNHCKLSRATSPAQHCGTSPTCGEQPTSTATS